MSTTTSGEANGSFAFALAALGAAGACFVLPALDEYMPGGAIYWQAAGVLIAIYAALRAQRQSVTLPARARVGVRLLAVAAVCLALVWVGGVAVLWLVWPR